MQLKLAPSSHDKLYANVDIVEQAIFINNTVLRH